MAKAKLQIGFEADVTGDDKPEIRITPLDIELPPDVAAAARKVQAFLDARDSQPGDGEADIPVKGKIPIRVSFVRTDVTIQGSMFFRVKG